MKFTSWLVMLSMTMGISQNLTFDTAPYGRLPHGWTAACTHGVTPPQWQILKDATAPSQPYVLGQLSALGPADRCPMAIFNDGAFRDGEVSVKFKPVSGKEDQAGGLVFRYRDENNYYVVRANALEKNVAVLRVQNGKRIPLGLRGKPATYAVKHNVNPNAWSILKVTFKGDNFSVYYDHRRILQVEDAALQGPGKVGLWTKADSVTYFDNFRVVKKR